MSPSFARRRALIMRADWAARLIASGVVPEAMPNPRTVVRVTTVVYRAPKR